MCGIAGVYSLRGGPVDPDVLQRMTDVQRHRGPDDQGLRLFSLRRGASLELPGNDQAGGYEGGVGFNRLSILDVSARGHQPMANADGSIFLAFNGEIYNAFDYVPELESAGFRFRSTSDTEVLLYLYERHGIEQTLARLNGMFAFCLVDLRQGAMFLARDRIGIKPLYWAEQDGLLLFSSEIKSFLMHPQFRPELDEARVDECLMYRFCAGEGTPLKDVRHLQPGCWMKVTPDGHSEQRYWSIPDSPAGSGLTAAQAQDRLAEILEGSIKRQLISDVKLGCQLSGGIDSSLITVVARQHIGGDLDTFSVVFDQPEFSEEPWISQAAARAVAESHRYPLTPEYVLDHLETATWHLDQPMNLPNTIGLFYLSQKARSLVTVLLSGEGADELFGGYHRFYYAATRESFRPWMPLLRHLPYAGPRFVNCFGDGRQTDPVEWFLTTTAFVGGDRLLELRPEAQLSPMAQRRRAIFDEGRGDYLGNCLKFDMQTYLVDLLIRQDKMTMAHSMENRVPYLDNEMVDFVRGLPSSYLVSAQRRLRQSRMRGTKILLKQLARRYFDDEFVYRMKCGFGLPLRGYYTHPRFREMMADQLLPGMRRRGVVRADVLERWWANLDQAKGYTMLEESIWSCLSFELWAQQFLDGRRPRAVAPPQNRPLVRRPAPAAL